MDVDIEAARKRLAELLSKAGPNGALPTPDQLFMAEEQPLEVDPWITEYLEAFPEYRAHIEAVKEEERKARFTPGDGESPSRPAD